MSCSSIRLAEHPVHIPQAPNVPLPATAVRSGKTLYGVFGLITLVVCECRSCKACLSLLRTTPAEYIIVLTGRELLGRLMGHNIYRATDFDILQLNPDASVQNPPSAAEAHLLALVKSHLTCGHFLYSYEWDLTRRLQAQWEDLRDDSGQALWELVRPSAPISICVPIDYTPPPCRLMTASSGTGKSPFPRDKHAINPRFSASFLQTRLIDVTVARGDQNVG